MTEALRSWGFAPGFYACVCSECGKQHTADKRAWRCLDCAESHVTEAAERAAYLRGLEDAERKVCDLAAMEDAGYGVSLETVYAAIRALAKEKRK